MSHLCSIHTQLKDASAIKEACRSLGWTIHENMPVRYYRGPGELCEFVAEFGATESFSQTYNIGFQRQQDGTYKVLIDNSIRGRVVLEEGVIAGETPRILNSLKQHYAIVAVTRKAQQMGARVMQQRAADGSTVLNIVGGRLGSR